MKILINKAFKPIYNHKTRFYVLYGGAGSGKSFSAAQKLLLDCAKQKETILVVRKNAKDNRYSTFEEFVTKLDETGLKKYCLTDLRNAQNTKPLIFDFGTHVSKILFSGLDDVEKIKSIKGITKIFGEEFSQCDKRDLMQLNIRLRDTDNPEFYICFNPVSKNHWLKSYFNLPDNPEEKPFFIDNKNEFLALWTNYTHNPFLKPHVIRQLKSYKTLDFDYYKVYCLGHWGNTQKEGKIFNFNKIITENDFEGIEAKSRFCGLDYGFSHYSALTDIKHIEKRLFAVKLGVYEKKRSVLEIAKLTKRYLNNNDILYSDVFVDSARPDLIYELEKMHILAQKAEKSVNSGINYVKSCNLWIVENDNLEFEFDNYNYKYDSKTDTYQDEPEKRFDDAMDSMRYGIFSHSTNYTDNNLYGYEKPLNFFIGAVGGI